MKKFRGTNAESGQIAIITVVIFMLLFSIIVVSFTRIMVAASREAVNDELRAKALAAAQAGVEDAKRVLTYCYSNPTETACSNILGNIGNQDCTELIRPGSALSRLVADSDISRANNSSDTYEVKVGDGDQYYLCMQIGTLVKYEGRIPDDGSSLVIPLTFRNVDNEVVSVRSITVEWHENSTDANADGIAGNGGSIIAGTDFPSWSTWTNNNNPATVRAELVGVPQNSPFTIENITNSARAWTMRPTSSTSGIAKTATYNINQYEPKTNPNEMTSPLLPVRCDNSSTYACSFTFISNTVWPTPDVTKYYLRLQAIYRGANARISAHGEKGEELYLDGVQSSIDVTGRSGDSFQRIRSSVEPSNGEKPKWYPEYAIDSGGKVCKDLSVSGDNGTDRCTSIYN